MRRRPPICVSRPSVSRGVQDRRHTGVIAARWHLALRELLGRASRRAASVPKANGIPAPAATHRCAWRWRRSITHCCAICGPPRLAIRPSPRPGRSSNTALSRRAARSCCRRMTARSNWQRSRGTLVLADLATSGRGRSAARRRARQAGIRSRRHAAHPGLRQRRGSRHHRARDSTGRARARRACTRCCRDAWIRKCCMAFSTRRDWSGCTARWHSRPMRAASASCASRSCGA